MSERRTTDAIGPEPYSVAQLRAMVFKGKGPLSRPLALSLLGRKRYPRKVADLTRLLMDEKEMPRLRNVAAQALGQVGTPEAARVLQRALVVKDDLALRGVLHGLSLAGGENARKSLARLAHRRGPVGQAVRRTATLLGYRLGARGAELRPPQERLLRVTGRRPIRIRVTAARRAQVDDAIAHVVAQAPALKLTSGGAVSLRCAGADWLFLFDAEAARGGPATLTARKTSAGVVVARTVREGAGWEVKYHVLTEPLKAGRIRIVVTTGRGRVILAGSAQAKGPLVGFQLGSMDAAGALAVDIKGRYEGGRLTFERARSALRRRPSATPSPMRPRRGTVDTPPVP